MFTKASYGSKKFNRVLAMLVTLTLVMSTFVCVSPVKAASGLLSFRTPTRASSELGTNYSERAVDGNINTSWASYQQFDPQWIYTDLGITSTVDRVDLTWEGGAYAKSYQIQVSNDTQSWSTIYSTTSNTQAANSLTVSGRGRYVRVYCTERVNGNG